VRRDALFSPKRLNPTFRGAFPGARLKRIRSSSSSSDTAIRLIAAPTARAWRAQCDGKRCAMRSGMLVNAGTNATRGRIPLNQQPERCQGRRRESGDRG